jgi:hypothetical protein
MTEIIKICQYHGDLTVDDVNKVVEKRWGIQPNIRYICKLCKKKYISKYKSNPDKKILIAERQKHYRKRDRDKILITRRIYARENKDRINETEKKRRLRNLPHIRKLQREKQLEWRESLDDNYIKSTICNKSKIKRKDISDELIETKRFIIKLKRKIKEMENGR